MQFIDIPVVVDIACKGVRRRCGGMGCGMNNVNQLVVCIYIVLKDVILITKQHSSIVHLHSKRMVLINLPVQSEIAAYSAIVTNESERTFHQVMLHAAIRHLDECVTTHLVTYLIAVLIVIYNFSYDIPTACTIVEVENRP